MIDEISIPEQMTDRGIEAVTSEQFMSVDKNLLPAGTQTDSRKNAGTEITDGPEGI